MAEIQNKLFKELNDVEENYKKKGDFKQERMFGAVGKIPIANTSNELVEMDFVDYGDFATFLHIRGTFSRFAVIILWVPKRRTNGRNGSANGDYELVGGVWGARNYRRG